MKRGKRKKGDPRRKGKERMIRKGLGSSKGKGILDQRGHWKKKEKFFGERRGFF